MFASINTMPSQLCFLLFSISKASARSAFASFSLASPQRRMLGPACWGSSLFPQGSHPPSPSQSFGPLRRQFFLSFPKACSSVQSPLIGVSYVLFKIPILRLAYKYLYNIAPMRFQIRITRPQVRFNQLGVEELNIAISPPRGHRSPCI